MGQANNEQVLPLLPLRGVLVFPYMVINLDIGRDMSVAALEEAMLNNDRRILLATQIDPEIEEPNPDAIYKAVSYTHLDVYKRQRLRTPDSRV